MSKLTKRVLKKFDSVVIDYEEGKDWAELNVDKNYIASVYAPFKESQRAETRRYLSLLYELIGGMITKLDDLDLRDPKKDLFLE